MIKSRPSNGLIPQQGGARRIKTMVIRVNRLKKKKKRNYFLSSWWWWNLHLHEVDEQTLVLYTTRVKHMHGYIHVYCCVFLLSACMTDPWNGWAPVRDCYMALLFISMTWHVAIPARIIIICLICAWFRPHSLQNCMCVIGPPLQSSFMLCPSSPLYKLVLLNKY